MSYLERILYLPKQRDRHKIFSLSIEEGSITQLASLPPLHKDPFDRLLIAQSLQYKLSMMTVDKTVKLYPATFFENTL